MSLMSLSDELLLGVIEHVQLYRDMAALSQQCRRLRSLSDMVTRRKYRRIKLQEPSQLQAGFKMLLSILRKPQLGTYVCQLELDRSPSYTSYGFGQRPRLRDIPLITLDPKDLEKLKQCICQAGFSEATEQDAVLNFLLRDPATLAKSVEGIVPYAHALAALIISVSPNMQSLAFCPVGYESPKKYRGMPGRSEHPKIYFFKYFMDRANSKGGQVPYLQNLQQVEFLPDSDSMMNDGRFYEDYDVYGSLNLVRRLPAIESVSFNAIVEPENPSVRIPPNSANYSKISIQRSILDFHTYCGVIESAKQLKELTFTIGGRGSEDSSHRSIHPESMLKSLLLHRNTLERLDFNIEEHVNLKELFDPTGRFEDDHDHGEDEETYNFEWEEELADLESRNDGMESLENASLRNFPKLKHISLGVNLLYFLARGIGNTSDHDPSQFSIVDHLPPNLESLRIYGYEKGKVARFWGTPDVKLDDHIAKLMEEKEKLPLLKRVEGVEECIPNEKMVDDPDNESELCWERESEEWTDYEY